MDTQGYQKFYPTQTVSWQSKLLDKLYVHGENKILGADGAGIVTAVGANVNSFKVGDEVCFIADDYLHGAWAELIAVSAKNVALKPANLSFTATAAMIGMATSLITEWVNSDFHESPQEFSVIMRKIVTPLLSEQSFFKKN